ncbi:MAG: tRNA modification GTPase [Planctomycetes bacterium]|nr:tRNA modification GTPase [Planctomycetota bacterium]
MFTTTQPDVADTIVAISSATGPAARAIVRLSGRRALDIADTLCNGRIRDRIVAGEFLRTGLQITGFRGRIPADVYGFRAPRTYTGQDIVEIHMISCQPLVDALIADCLNAGARAAQPGEFTLRAFLAGKIDLTHAEAVLGVIDAGDRHELKQSIAQLAGGVANPLQSIRNDLLNLLADVEAGLDFADEDIQFVASDDMLKRIGAALAHLTNLRRQLEQRLLESRPFRVVLAGEPNAGKSSLFNALVGRDSALVSPTPGTTRDYLEATIELAGCRIELVDIAGFQDASGEIESSAQALGRKQLEDADMILWCVASDRVERGRDLPPKAVSIATKSDLAAAPTHMLATSAVTGGGLTALREMLATRVRAASHSALAPSSSRCKHHVQACIDHLRRTHAIALENETPELLALELRLALDELAAMTGAIFTEDLLDRIFSRFCIGK